MLQLPLGRLIEAYRALASFNQMITTFNYQKKEPEIIDRDFQGVLRSSDDFAQLCEVAGLSITHLAAKKVCEDVRMAKLGSNAKWVLETPDMLRFMNAMAEMVGCMKNESSTKVAMVLPPDMVNLYEPTASLFGDEVKNKFPASLFDIDESAKCLALGRYTACVFHLMRVMELSLHAVHKCLGLPQPLVGNDRNWGNILNAIRDNYKSRRAFAEIQTFQQLHARLDAVKDAWRNGTMHVERKYTKEDAETIYAMVRGFMMNVASRMDENGLPAA